MRLSKSARLHYPYHPLYGVELEVFGAARGQRDMTYVRLSIDGASDAMIGLSQWFYIEVRETITRGLAKVT